MGGKSPKASFREKCVFMGLGKWNFCLKLLSVPTQNTRSLT
ncbi:hypothetical protein HPHPP25_0795 [Helicobacter pylori Hp P-25]|nr:hypothetical protein HPHPP25_0795 [Helicobacter pylori Hp P-25]EJC35279.1 hypothetical protein HPHPP25C_0612 [Helicobacter pylori Hp P-25c]EJC35872.1 hypothetical protein HPHPP25D_1475 [Helicobacter pylori Hp P-25d]